MTGLCSRRTLLTIAGAAAVSSITAAHAADGKTSKPAKRTWPDMPTVPTDFNAERCFVELQDAGDGVVFQGPKNGPVVRLALPFDARKKVWDYSKAFRRACGISVPFGVLKTTDGRYIPVPQVTTEEFAKLSGLKPE